MFSGCLENGDVFLELQGFHKELINKLLNKRLKYIGFIVTTGLATVIGRVDLSFHLTG